MVLKFSCFKKRTSACGGVSVPLRGYGFEIRLNPKIGGAGGATVSVPLRGYGFEIAISNIVYVSDGVVSVPLRGYGFEIFGGLEVYRVDTYEGFRPLTGIWF